MSAYRPHCQPSTTPTAGAFDVSVRYAPDTIVEARTSADVEAAVRAAARTGKSLTVFGTGHGAFGDVTEGVLLCTQGLSGVTLDAERRTARIGAGTRWRDVLAATTPVGLAGLCGSSPSVGVIGYLLGGGIGPLARTYGFAADHVRSLEIVTPADGLVTVTPSDHPQLFWALRGGKGGFGVVTAATIDLLPVERFCGGGLYFAADAARDVLGAVAEWAPELPESATASVALLRLPDVPEVAAPIRGQLVTHVRFATTEDPERAEHLLGPIRDVAAPILDTVTVLPYARIGEVHRDPTHPQPVMCAGQTLRSVDPDTIDALLEVAGPGRQVPLAQVELRSLGGALGRDAALPNAVGGRDAAWNLFVAAAPMPGMSAETRRDHVRSVLDVAAPWHAPVNLVNFVGRANDAAELVGSWTAEQNERLDGIRRAADPDGLLAFGPREHRRPDPRSGSGLWIS
jgi:FAD/FMN-containing dehydrogenase